MLSDSQANVAEAYDVCDDEWKGHESVPQRAVFVIDTTQTTRYAWQAADARMKPDFAPVENAVKELPPRHKPDISESPTLSIEYDESLEYLE